MVEVWWMKNHADSDTLPFSAQPFTGSRDVQAVTDVACHITTNTATSGP